MSFILMDNQAHDQVTRLTDSEKAIPLTVFQNVFIDHKLYEFKDFLADALECLMVADKAPFDSSFGRSGAILFTGSIIKCLEAGKLLAELTDMANSTAQSSQPQFNLSDIGKLTRGELLVAQEHFLGQAGQLSNDLKVAVNNVRQIAQRLKSLKANSQKAS